MFLRSGNPLLTFLLSYHVWGTSKIEVTFWFKRFSRLPKHCFLDKNALNLQAVAQKTLDGHTTNALLSTLLSCHVIFHVTFRHVMSHHVMSRHVTSRHVTLRHVVSRHTMSRRKSPDGHTANALLSSDFFHTQFIKIRHNRVRWLSRRVPIPYRISGI